MESKILAGGGGFVQFSNFIYVTYCQLACFGHFVGFRQNNDPQSTVFLLLFLADDPDVVELVETYVVRDHYANYCILICEKG